MNDFEKDAMPPVFVMTSRWWMDAGAPSVWALVRDPASWPAWWHHLQPGGAAGLLLWRTPWMSRVELRLSRTHEEPFQEFEYAIDGALKGRVNGILQYIPHIRGVFFTMRFEFVLAEHQRNPMLLALVSWWHFADVRRSVRRLGRQLRCSVGRPLEWSGHSRN